MMTFLRCGGRTDRQRKGWNLYGGAFLLILVACVLAGCGEEPEQQHYQPLSPLPLRVSGSGAVTPKPVLTATPAEDGRPTPPQSTPTTPAPTPTTDVTHAAPTPKLQAVTPTPPPPAPTATSTPEPQPTPTPKPQAPQTTKPSQAGNALADSASANIVTSYKKAVASEQVASSEEAEQEPIVMPDGLTLERLMVCAAVKNREPAGCEQRFSLAETRRVFTWMKVADVKTPKAIKHVYFLDDEKIATVTLNLKYTAMRTWSQKTFKPDQTGNWKVVVMTSAGEVIAERQWVVTP